MNGFTRWVNGAVVGAVLVAGSIPAGTARAAVTRWGLDAPNGDPVGIQRGGSGETAVATHPTDLLGCIAILPGAHPDTSGCPDSIALRIASTPPGVTACFGFTSTGACIRALPLVSTDSAVVGIFVSVAPGTPLGKADILVSGSSQEPRTVSVKVPVVVSEDVLDFEETVEIYRGLDVPAPITVTHPPDAPGTMTLSMGCDAGITAGPVSVAPTATDATMTIRTAAQAALGVHDCRVRAAIAGVIGALPHPITVVIVDPFTVTLETASVVVMPGCGRSVIPANVTRHPEFTAPLTYSVAFTGPPSPVPTLRPEVAVLDAATDAPRLDIVVRMGTWPGTYNYRLTTNGGGDATEIDTFSVVVAGGTCLAP
jgi:hypothetical protein